MTTATTTFRSRAAREAAELRYGNAAYWAYLEESAIRLNTLFTVRGYPARAAEMFTRSLAEALDGNNGA